MMTSKEARLVPVCGVILRNCHMIPTAQSVHTHTRNHFIEAEYLTRNCAKCDSNKNGLSQIRNEQNTEKLAGKRAQQNSTVMSKPIYISAKNLTSRLRNSLCNVTQIVQTRHYCSRCTFEMGKLPVGFRTSPPWRVLFFGTDDFSVSSLHALNESRLSSSNRTVDSLEVVNAMHKQTEEKQMSPVLRYANEAGIKIHNWPIKVDEGRYDVGVLSSFGRMIPERIIHKFPYGIINIHPSLLPRWRGASPITHTILNGDSVTGVSIMEIRPKHFDIGPLLMQEEIPVPDRCSTQQLQDILAPMGTNMLMTVLGNLPVLERCEVEQSPYGVTYAHKVDSQMFYVDWKNQTMLDIDRQYRALHETGPIMSVYKKRKIKLLDMCSLQELSPSESYLQRLVQRDYKVQHESLALPGSALYIKDQQALIIKCKDGWVGFRKLVANNPMTAGNFFGVYLKNCDVANTQFTSMENELNKDCNKERVAV